MYRSTIQIIHINLIWLTKLLSKKHSNRLCMNILKTAAEWILPFYNATPDMQEGQILWAFCNYDYDPITIINPIHTSIKIKVNLRRYTFVFNCSPNYTFPVSKHLHLPQKFLFSRYITNQIQFSKPKKPHTDTNAWLQESTNLKYN